jgi:hypothetical protein
MAETPDFSGYATKNGIVCSDNRVIGQDAFKENDKEQVPLVWQHRHDDIDNVLGHAILENREDGVYCYGFFNDSEKGQLAKEAVRHGDIKALSIYANQLKHAGQTVVHGAIREVSLVLAGANPGAFIDELSHGEEGSFDAAIFFIPNEESMLHSEGEDHGTDNGPGNENDEDGLVSVPEVLASMNEQQNAVVHALIGEALKHAESTSNNGDTVADNETGTDDGETIQDVFDTLTDKQKAAVAVIFGKALEADGDGTDTTASNDNSGSAEHSASTEDDKNNSLQHSQEGTEMNHNLFEKNGAAAQGSALQHGASLRKKVSPETIKSIFKDAERLGSLKESFMAHSEELLSSQELQHAGLNNYGFGDTIDVLFPDAKLLASQPEIISRRSEWAGEVFNGTKKSPFARVRTIVADITADEARARGYVTGNLKKEEIVRLLGRKTTPTTIYKKQKIDRDDLIDITDLDIIAWLKAEMRVMLEEEIARAVLLGDGREYGDDDKIDEENIRPIATDDPMYAHPVVLSGAEDVNDQIEELIRARANFRGSGTPTFYTTLPFVTDMLLAKDTQKRRIYSGMDELARDLMVSKITTVEVMEQYNEFAGIFVNLADYTIGADKGGEVSLFDDFDIDYNQFKYLIETRISGALTKPKAAVVVRRPLGTSVTPTAPSFDGETNKVTIPNTTGVAYLINGVAQPAGDQVITRTVDITVKPKKGFYLANGSQTHWSYSPSYAGQ